MSNPKYWWWESVKRCIRQYPRLTESKADLQAMPVVALNKSAGGSSGSDGRKTERYALRQLTPAEEKALDAVENALALTETLPDGETRLRLIRMYYWSGMRLQDAAGRLYIDESTAKRYNGQFVRLAARGLGYLPQEHTKR